MIDLNAPAYPTQNGCKNDPGMIIRATMAINVPSDEIQALTWKHLSLKAQERLAGITKPTGASNLSGEDKITAQIDEMKFHARVNAALRVIAADALIAELNKTEAES